MPPVRPTSVRSSGPRPITAADLKGVPGLRRAAQEELLRRQPVTVKEALAIPDVGRRATKHLLDLGLITDPEAVQQGMPPVPLGRPRKR